MSKFTVKNLDDDKNTVVVFSYWCGKLPLNTLLHFYSFRKMNRNVKYTLYLETDRGFEGFISDDISKQLDKLGIEVEYVSLSRMQQKVPGLQQPRFLKVYSVSIFRKLRNFFLRFILSPIGRQLARGGIYKIGNLYTHKIFGMTPNHRSVFSLSYDNLTFRSDIFRIIKLLDHFEVSAMYLDLDVFVNIEITENRFRESFVFRWDKFEFANNAGIFVHSKDLSFRSYLKEFLSSQQPLQGWFLFSEKSIRKLNLFCLPCEVTDPYWSNLLKDFVSPVDFFKQKSSSLMNYEFIISTFLFAHWHNNWTTEVEIGSIYDLCANLVGLTKNWNN